MIVAEQKGLDEIRTLVAEAERVLVVGCGTCVTVCFSGGAHEAAILATALRMTSRLAGGTQDVTDMSVQRQCEWEFLDAIKDEVAAADLVLSLGCGVGVQAIAEAFPDARVLPGQNTVFLGQPTEPGVWAERCTACGNCVLGQTGGICPITRCSKSLLNGPCGGSQDGHCEIDPDIECAWQKIWDRLRGTGQLETLMEIEPPKDWSTSHAGGPRRLVREDLRLTRDEDG
jgi:ferredoxin